MSRHFSEELDRLIRARYTLLYVVTWEEERAMRIFMELAERQRKSLYEWSITNGLRCVYGVGGQGNGSRTRDALQMLNEVLQKEGPAIYVLKDFHAYLEAPEMIRQARAYQEDPGFSIARAQAAARAREGYNDFGSPSPYLR